MCKAEVAGPLVLKSGELAESGTERQRVNFELLLWKTDRAQI